MSDHCPMTRSTASGLEASILWKESHFLSRRLTVGSDAQRHSIRNAGLLNIRTSRLIHRTYASLIEKIVELPAPSLLALASSPEESVNLVLLLDQFSRNIHRGPAADWTYN